MVCKMACNLHTIARVFSIIKHTGILNGNVGGGVKPPESVM